MKISSLTLTHGLRRPSIDYYAFRGVSYEQFQALQVIYALFSQLQALPYCSEDILVVRHKAQFWLTEILAAYTGSPHHPITRDLQVVLQSFPLAQEDWIGILTAVEMDIDSLLLENNEELQSYADRLYGGLFRMIGTVLSCGEGRYQDLALARTLLMFLQHPERRGVKAYLPENIQTQVYTLFDSAGRQAAKPLALLARLYKHQAQEPMVKLSPLKTLWLSICERL